MSYTLKTAIISQNKSNLVWTLPAWNVLETFPSCKLSSSLQDPCWSSSPCPACAFMADSTCCWQCIFVLFLPRYLLLPYCILLSFSGIPPILYIASLFHQLWPVSEQKVFPCSLSTSVPSDVLIAWCSIHLWFPKWHCAKSLADLCPAIPWTDTFCHWLWEKKLPRRKLSSLLISLSSPILPRT